MKYCGECGAKTLKMNSICVKCGRNVDADLERYKRLKRYTSLGMMASLGVFLGSRNWNVNFDNSLLTMEQTPEPSIETDSELFDYSSQSMRFTPEVILKKSVQNDTNQALEGDFLLQYEEDQVILLAYLGDETEVTLPEQVTIIGAEAFMKHDLLKTVTLPTSLWKIQDNAFALCLSLEEIKWSQQLRSLGEGSFRHCESLSVLNLPDSLEEIGANTFYGCENLKSVTMGDSVEVLEQGTFKNCWNLEDIRLSSNLREIASSAFENCGGLTEITIPDLMEKMAEDLFSTCFSLQTVWVRKDSYGEAYVNEWLPETEVKFY